MRFVYVSFFLLITSALKAQPSLEWAVQLSDNSVQTVKDQVVDDSGYTYTVGEFAGTVDFNPSGSIYNLTASGSSRDIYITKLDSDGNLVWAVNIGNGNDEVVNDIAYDNNGYLILTGTFLQTVDFDPGIGSSTLTSTSNYRTAFILKLTTDAQFEWAKNPNWRTEGVGVHVGPNGDVYAALNTTEAQPGQIISFPGSGWSFASVAAEFFVWKLSAAGATQWVKEGENGGVQQLPSRSIIVDGSDNVVVVGKYLGSTTFLDLGAFGGPNNISGVSGDDGFVFKLNSSGIYQWHRTFTSSSTVRCTAVHYVDDNSFLIGGNFTGSVNFNPPLATFSHTAAGSFDGFLLEMDYQNTVLSSYSFGGTGIEWIRDLSSDDQGGRYVAGRFTGTADFDGTSNIYNLSSEGSEDAFLLKTTSNGSFSWAFNYGSSGDEEMFAVTNFNDAIYVGGNFQGTIDMDPQGSGSFLTAAGGGADGFVAKLDEPCVGGPLTPSQSNLTDVTAECQVNSLTAPTASNCLGTFSGTHNASFPITASTTVTWTYDDGNGNTSTQTQQVVINDNTAPVADLGTLADVTAQCEVTSLTAPTATDNCAGIITGSHNAQFPITSSATVTWTFDDGNGNSSTQTQNVVINDLTAPVPTVANLSFISDECEITSLIAPLANDNCAGTIIGTHNANFPITSSTTITWTYDDGNGNTSTQTQDVVITPIDNSVTQLDPITLMADANGYNYQWVDCNNGNALITGETGQTFVATVNGSYAVEIDNGNCSVTSTCIQILTVGIEGSGTDGIVSVYPNPTDGNVTIKLGDTFEQLSLQVIDALGRVVLSQAFFSTNQIDMHMNIAAGCYFLQLQAADETLVRMKLIKR